MRPGKGFVSLRKAAALMGEWLALPPWALLQGTLRAGLEGHEGPPPPAAPGVAGEPSSQGPDSHPLGLGLSSGFQELSTAKKKKDTLRLKKDRNV